MDTLTRLRAGELAGARRLDLRCGLTALPPEVYGLADTLEVLNLSGNALRTLPDDLGRLHRLRVLFASDNPFTTLPPSLGDCAALEMVGFKASQIDTVPAEALPPRLRWLILTDNRIEALPDALGERPRLQKLMLAGNRLAALPATLAGAGRLELLRIAANRLDTLPGWIPELPRLAWLAYAGNPFHAADEAAAVADCTAQAIPWPALEVHERLGEGASGLIHRATWRDAPDATPRDAALKLFKGSITSDGTPASEIAACLAAGPHPALIGGLGRVHGHPADTPGLLMPLVDPALRTLAGPPSVESCTRDVYDDTLRFTAASALAIATGITAAAAHLHGRGLLHGDLYAHNVLWDGATDCRLGDFGAASFLPSADAPRAAALQRIEARACGCLLEELAARTPDAPPMLAALAARCLDERPSQRPRFDEILATLADGGSS